MDFTLTPPFFFYYVFTFAAQFTEYKDELFQNSWRLSCPDWPAATYDRETLDVNFFYLHKRCWFS